MIENYVAPKSTVNALDLLMNAIRGSSSVEEAAEIVRKIGWYVRQDFLISVWNSIREEGLNHGELRE